MTEPRTVLRGGLIVDGTGSGPVRADLAFRDGIIEDVGVGIDVGADDNIVDVSGRYLLPGFIDAHSHADGMVFSPDIQLALLSQGVTTIIAGQDGVSYAPGDGGYASEYFGALIGDHPHYRGGGVAELLATYDGSTPINVGYLIPAGTVRFEVRGYAQGAASRDELARMKELVERGLDEGALGLSSGLDYVPGLYADVSELTELCEPVAAAGGIYVTHMRGGYETTAAVGTAEVEQITLASGVPVHISHYHGPSELLIELCDRMTARGVDLSFDAYPYRRGCSLLAMPTLPAHLLTGASAEVVAALMAPEVRQDLLADWFPTLDDKPAMGPGWPDDLTLAHVGAASHAWSSGMTIRDAAARAATSPADFVIDVLIAARLQVSVVMAVRTQRPYDDLAKLLSHPDHVMGSDGIFVGSHPHPRGWGSFTKYLRVFVRERADLTWGQAAQHLAGRTARRFGLRDRGILAPGFVADIAVVDPETVSDAADYPAPRENSVGIGDVFVAGRRVLAEGQLTGELAGSGLRRSTTPALSQQRTQP